MLPFDDLFLPATETEPGCWDVELALQSDVRHGQRQRVQPLLWLSDGYPIALRTPSPVTEGCGTKKKKGGVFLTAFKGVFHLND